MAAVLSSGAGIHAQKQIEMPTKPAQTTTPAQPSRPQKPKTTTPAKPRPTTPSRTQQESSPLNKTIVLTPANTSRIYLYRDGEGNNTSTGYGFYIHIEPNCLQRNAGDPDFVLDGVIYSYTQYDGKYFNKALELINSYKIKPTAKKKRTTTKKGTTEIAIFKDGELWIDLIETPEERNFEGDLDSLMDALVEMVGGAPEFGGPGGTNEDWGPEYYHDPDIDPYGVPYLNSEGEIIYY